MHRLVGIVVGLFLVTAVYAEQFIEDVINPVTKLDSATSHRDLLWLTNIIDQENTIANLELNYFESADCSGDVVAHSKIFNKMSPVLVKHRRVLKILGAAVYNSGRELIGVDGMSRVRSIAVKLGVHHNKVDLGNSYFFATPGIGFTKSYCIADVVCGNGVCQTNAHFTPFAVMLFSAQAPQMSRDLTMQISQAEQFVQDYSFAVG